MRTPTITAAESIDLELVKAVLTATLDAHPPKEDGYRLSADSSAIAEIYGTMIFHNVQKIPISELSTQQLEALERWHFSQNTESIDQATTEYGF